MSIDTNRLFRADYTTGDLNVIQVFADVIGFIAVVVISITGFGIVQATIMKNAIHGLYAVFPKFWDKVDEAKKTKLGLQQAEGGNQIMMVMGSISVVLLSCLPNVKAMTDFDTDLMDAKAYFMKALPLAVVQIFVGVFIFFGYPSQVAQTASDFGTSVFSMVLTNVNPTSWVEALPGKLVVLDLATDNALTSHDKVVNDVTRKCYGSYVSYCNDIDKSRRNELARQIESWVMSEMANMSEYTDDTRWEYTLNTAVVNGASANQPTNVDDQSGNQHLVRIAAPMNTWDSGTTKDLSNKQLMATIMFTKIAAKGEKVANVVCSMNVGNDKIHTNRDKNGSIEITFPQGEAALVVPSSASGTADNGASVNISVSGNKVIISGKTAGKNIENSTTIKSISGLSYQINGATHKITTINLKQGSGISFVPSTKDYNNWDFGGVPSLKNTDTNMNTNTNSNKSNTSNNSDGGLTGNN